MIKLTRGRKKKKEKKDRKNVYLKEKQIAYILKRCGENGNFSSYLSKIIDLYISLSDALIVQELTPETIEDLKNEILDEYNRKTYSEKKVMEYKEIYEDLTRYGRYIIPNLKKFGSTSLRVMEFFLKFDYDELNKNKIDILEKLVKYNNILDEINIDYREKIVELKGNYPYSLIWYAKFFILMVSQFKNSWELVKTIPEELIPAEHIRKVRIYFKRGESPEISKQKAIEFFDNTIIKLKDVDNHGLWNFLNNQSNSIMDNQYLSSYLKRTSEEIVPFQGILEEIKSENSSQTVTLTLQFYEKIHLIANLNIIKNKYIFSCSNEIVLKMLEDSLNYLEIPFKMEKKGINIILSLISI